MIVERATVKDAAEILTLQKLAYRDEAAIYNDYSIPPLIQTLEELETDFDRQLFLKATDAGRILASVRAHIEHGTCFIGRLIVHPDVQNQGIGSRLMREIEERFPQASRFELFTGDRSARNLHLYRKLGYRPCRTQQLTDRLTLVFLEKAGNVGQNDESTSQ
jgi:ribosomal protein S18 acetylase RimI-like enzyme